MNQKPKGAVKSRKRIGLSELQVLVSLLVKFSRKNNGDSLPDIWKPKWWPSNIRFTYPIKRNKKVSSTMWRKELVAILTKYYYTTRNNNTEHLNGRFLLNTSDFLWEIKGQICNKKNNAAVAAPAAITKHHEVKSANSQNINLSEKTLKMLMPRLEVRVFDVLETDEYRKIKENKERNRQEEFLRNFSLITIPEYDKLNLDARYTLRASTKIQSNSQQSSPKSRWNETQVPEKESPLVKKKKNQLQKKKNDKETAKWEKKICELENNDKPVTLDDEMIVVDDEPIIVEKTPEKEVLPVQRKDNMSSSIVTVDLDELSLKARLYLQQCSPSYVKLNKCKKHKENRRKKLRKQKIKVMKIRRVLEPREARKICRSKINSSFT